jgi:hypothetical protein
VCINLRFPAWLRQSQVVINQLIHNTSKQLSMAPQIPWNEELETVLLACVISKGTHVCSKKKVTQSWNEVNDMFFAQPELTDLKDTYYVSGNIRKLREKYKTIVANIEKDIADGNQSGKEGELSKLYQHVCTICEDISEKDAEKVAATALREKLNETERMALEQAGPLKRKQLDGDITDNTRSDHIAPLSFDEKLFMLATAGNKKAKKSYDEDNLEVALLKWINNTQQSLLEMYIHSAIDVQYRQDIEDIGLKTLVSSYCSSKSTDNASLTFKTELREMGLPMVVCTKVYMCLQEWLRQLEEAGENHFVSSDDSTAVTTSSNASSNISSVGMFSPLTNARMR